tara:strand:- start:2030 stop:2191 length:162 start_codon:yes stop_codon:yes gene_type:complete
MTIGRKIIRFLVKKNYFKNLLVFALKELAKLTDNTIDDQFVKTLEARLYPKSK